MMHPRKPRRRLFYLIGTYRAARSSLDSFQSDARMSDKIPPAVRSQMMAAVRVNGPKLTNTCDDHIGSPSYGALP
jgi:hypothetical protein